MNYLTMSALMLMAIVGLFAVTYRSSSSIASTSVSPTNVDAVQSSTDPVLEKTTLDDVPPPDDSYTPEHRGVG